jgi:glycosyltransferase involved in cell wall biosynthesis
MKIMVLIPAFNEEGSIRDLLKKVLKKNFNEIVVVNDGSTDSTKNMVESMDIVLINHEKRRGIGEVTRTGIKHFLKGDFDYLVRIDGDGQHNVDDIKVLIDHINENDLDVVLGSRYLKNPKLIRLQYSVIGEAFFWILREIIEIKSSLKLSDPTSGFMLLNKDAASFLSKNTISDKYEPHIYTLLSLGGFKIDEVVVTINPRRFGKSFYEGMGGYIYGLEMIFRLLLMK